MSEVGPFGVRISEEPFTIPARTIELPEVTGYDIRHTLYPGFTVSRMCSKDGQILSQWGRWDGGAWVQLDDPTVPPNGRISPQ